MRILSLNVWGGMLHAPLLDYLAAVDVFVSSHVKLRPVILLAGRPARRINAIAPRRRYASPVTGSEAA